MIVLTLKRNHHSVLQNYPNYAFTAHKRLKHKINTCIKSADYYRKGVMMKPPANCSGLQYLKLKYKF